MWVCLVIDRQSEHMQAGYVCATAVRVNVRSGVREDVRGYSTAGAAMLTSTLVVVVRADISEVCSACRMAVAGCLAGVDVRAPDASVRELAGVTSFCRESRPTQPHQQPWSTGLNAVRRCGTHASDGSCIENTPTL